MIQYIARNHIRPLRIIVKVLQMALPLHRVLLSRAAVSGDNRGIRHYLSENVGFSLPSLAFIFHLSPLPSSAPVPTFSTRISATDFQQIPFHHSDQLYPQNCSRLPCRQTAPDDSQSIFAFSHHNPHAILIIIPLPYNTQL